MDLLIAVRQAKKENTSAECEKTLDGDLKNRLICETDVMSAHGFICKIGGVPL